MSQTESFFQSLKKLLSPSRKLAEVEENAVTARQVEEEVAAVRDSEGGLCGEEFTAIEALQSLNSQRSPLMESFPSFTQDIDTSFTQENIPAFTQNPSFTQDIDTSFNQENIPTFTQNTVFTDQVINLSSVYLDDGVTTTINQVELTANQGDKDDDAHSTTSYIIDSRAPVVVPRLLWFQQDLSEEQRMELLELKRKSPIWFQHISVSGLFIGGKFSSLFTTIRKMIYPDQTNLRNEVDIENWFNEHTTIVKVPMKEKATLKTDGRINGYQALVYGRSFRFAIKLRLNKVRSEPRKFQPYLFVSKSLVGCRDYTFDARKPPPNDQSYTIENKDKFAAAGLGLFADRDFVKNEHIGLYCGKLTLKKKANDTGYNIEWMKDKRYVVDAQGGVGFKVYFGWHFANNAERMEDANVIIDDELHVFALRDIKRGEEILFYYGERCDNVKNKKRKRSKK